MMAEVERIWLLYDIDENGTLDYDEIKMYLDEEGTQYLSLNDKQKKRLFDKIDVDGSGTIDKDEMIEFLNILMEKNNAAMLK